MKRIFSFLFCLAFSIAMSAQTSGGQITRPNKSTHIEKKKEVNNKQTATQQEVQTEHTYETPPPPPNIQPVSVNNLYTHNIVVGNFGILSNAQMLCQYLRGRGYSSVIYFNGQLYRVIISGTNNVQEAMNIKNRMISSYPGAFILYFENGQERKI